MQKHFVEINDEFPLQMYLSVCLHTVKDALENVLFDPESSLSMFKGIFNLIKEFKNPPQQELWRKAFLLVWDFAMPLA